MSGNDEADTSKHMSVEEQAREANAMFWQMSQQAEEAEADADAEKEDEATDGGTEEEDETTDGGAGGDETTAGGAGDGGSANPPTKKKKDRKYRTPQVTLNKNISK
jgi:hypothetical protein